MRVRDNNFLRDMLQVPLCGLLLAYRWTVAN